MIRFLLALVGGSAVAFGLLFLMQALIATGRSAITETKNVRIVDFVRVAREEHVESKRSKPDRPPNPEAPPPDIVQPTLEGDAEGVAQETAIQASGSVGAPVPVADIDVDIASGLGVVAGTADGDYLPIVKVAPMYPERAIERGIEGYVIVEFTVTKTGAVRDPKVVEYYPSTIFNKAALAAALKFKYKPRVVNGEPIEVHGVLNKITFQLED